MKLKFSVENCAAAAEKPAQARNEMAPQLLIVSYQLTSHSIYSESRDMPHPHHIQSKLRRPNRGKIYMSLWSLSSECYLDEMVMIVDHGVYDF